MIIQQTIIIENKTVDKIAPIHEAQLLTYLKLTDFKLGFLLNWNVPLMKDGIKRMVNNLEEYLPAGHGSFSDHSS
jgi:GxxExxY protein